MVEICPACKKIITTLQRYAVNNFLNFCSQRCLDEYMQIYTEYYNQLEVRVREDLGYQDETSLEVLSHVELCEQVLENPIFSYTMTDCREQDFFFQYGEVKFSAKKYYLLIIYTIIDGKNAFLFVGASEYLSFVEAFLFNLQMTMPPSITEEPERVDRQELATLIELKKGELLADLMGVIGDNDFSFSEHVEYIGDSREALTDPDEVFLWKDDASNEMLTYSKIMEKGQVVYYYVVIALYQDGDIHPILMFPTRDKKSKSLFQKGVKQFGQTSN